MTFLTALLHGPDLSRLDDAVAGNITAQERLHRAGADAARSAIQTRREVVVERRKAGKATRRALSENMHTGDVRDMVNEMLLGFVPHQDEDQ